LNAGDVTVIDSDRKKLDDIRKEIPVKTSPDLDKALETENYESAFICTPPSLHVQQATKLIERGLHCLIEKPLSNNLEGIDDLIKISESKNRAVLIGYTIRFSPLLKKIEDLIAANAIGKVLFLKASVGYYLPYWRPDEDYRRGYGANESLGGGIVLDASHEIDYARFFLGEVEEVSSICRKLSGLEIDTEDYAEITMLHKNGACSHIHLDYLQTNYRRSCEIVGEKGMIIWDINEGVLKQYGIKDKEYHSHYEGLNANVNNLYMEETKHFFRCIDGTEDPLIGLREGRRIQEIIMKIKEASREGRTLSV
jgi:predicted dehydrogenase